MSDWPVDWSKVRASLLEIGTMVEGLLPDRSRLDYLDLVWAGEEWLALDHVASWLADEQVAISAELRTEMMDLAEALQKTDEIKALLDLCPSA